MAQAMATAQGFSAPAFGLPAALPPLACPLPGEARGRNPRITTATALASVLVHAGVALLLLRDPLPAPTTAAPVAPSAFPAVALTWTAPPAVVPSVETSAEPAQTVAPVSEPAPEPVPVADVPPPVLTAAVVAETVAPPPVPVPRPTLAPAPKPRPLEKTVASKPPARPKPAAVPLPSTPVPAPVPASAPVPDFASVASPDPAPAGPAAAPASAATPSVSPPVTAEPSLLRGEDGVPVSRDARYLEPPKPPEYPRRAVQLGLEGTVVVRALVEGGGVPRTVRIVTGSGVDSLDAAAIRAVSGWKFAVSDHGSLWVEIPVQFRLR